MHTRKFLIIIALLLVNACSTLEIGIETTPRVKVPTQASPLATPIAWSATPMTTAASPLPLPPDASPIPANHLDCNTTGGSITCFDKVLSVRFTYPAAWGTIMSRLGQGECGGYDYTYWFEHAPVSADGTSVDFCIPGRGGDLTSSFSHIKYEGGTIGEHVCDDYSGIEQGCLHVQPNVIVVTEFPEFGPTPDDCIGNGPGVPQTPTQFVVIHLPPESKVQRLVFVIDLLSSEAKDALFAPIGGFRPSNYGPECLVPANRAQFTQALQNLWQAMQTGQVEAETSRNLVGTKTLATSFQVIQP